MIEGLLKLIRFTTLPFALCKKHHLAIILSVTASLYENSVIWPPIHAISRENGHSASSVKMTWLYIKIFTLNIVTWQLITGV